MPRSIPSWHGVDFDDKLSELGFPAQVRFDIGRSNPFKMKVSKANFGPSDLPPDTGGGSDAQKRARLRSPPVAEPQAPQRELINALEGLRSQLTKVIAVLEKPNRGWERL